MKVFWWGTIVSQSEFSQPSQSMKSIPLLVLSLFLFNEPPHYHGSPTVAQTTPCVATRETFIPKQSLWLCKKSPMSLSSFFCYCSIFFFTAPHKTYTTLSQSQYISTISFEAAVYNNTPPCCNPFKGTKKKVILLEDYFFQSLEVFCFGMPKFGVRYLGF